MSVGGRASAAFDGGPLTERALPVSLLRHRPRLNPDLGVIDNIAKVIGVGAALRLCARFGGSRVYVAVKLLPESPIAIAIGYPKAARLSTYFGGERLSIPSDGAQANRARIAKMRGRGLSVSEIARRLGCTERYVYKVLARFRDE